MPRNYRPFMDAAAEIFTQSEEKADYTTTFQSFLDSLKPVQNGGWNVAVDDAELVVTKAAMKQLLKDRFGGIPAVLNDERLQPSTVLQYMRDLIRGHEERSMAVRRSGINIDAILSEQYVLFDNRTLTNALVTMAHDGTLPPADDLYAHTFYVSDAARDVHLRLIAPDHWNFKGNDGDIYYGSIVFSNNETGTGSLHLCAALARVSCFNYTIANNQLSLEHRYSTIEELFGAMRLAVRQMQDYSKTMFERMETSQSVMFNDPVAVFNLIAERMKLGDRMLEDTMAYWENQGEDNSLFGITQALTWGVQVTTPAKGRRKPKWDVRSQIESNVTNWADEILNMHQQGEDINEFVSQAELVGKHRVLEVLEGNQWLEAAAAVRGLEAEAWL